MREISEAYLPVNQNGRGAPARFDIDVAKRDAKSMYLEDKGISRLPSRYTFVWKMNNGCWHGILHDRETSQPIQTGIRILIIQVRTGDLVVADPDPPESLAYNFPIQRSVANSRNS